MGLEIRLEQREEEEIQDNPEEYVRNRLEGGASVIHIGDRLDAAGVDRALARQVADRLTAEEDSETRERRERNQPKARNVIVSVICGILVYVAVVAVFVVIGVGGLVIQIPALILAIVLGRILYSKLRGGKDATESTPRPQLDRNERAKRLSR